MHTVTRAASITGSATAGTAAKRCTRGWLSSSGSTWAMNRS